MVCSVENGRMAVMARILRGPSFSQNASGDVGNQKFLARYIRKEIIEADEPNLLDEKDMHIFGLKPMDDPLHLLIPRYIAVVVRSQSKQVTMPLMQVMRCYRICDPKVEPKSSVERKKPPKKPKRNGPSVRTNQLAEGSSRNLMKQMIGSLQKLGKNYKLPKSEEQNHNVVDQTCYKNPHGNDMHYQAQTDVPAPLATKVYYSQRNNRLRSEIGYMFHAADSHELDYNIKVEATQLDNTQSNTSLQRSTPSGLNSSTGLKTVTNPQITDSKTLL